ncbi:MAG: sigma-70 family RNA polymerase sigma factor [Acidobacteria bacterium]|nr:sigma-70 family RNA polymerase sigma factor [Acidobacteriota bacterium]
MEKSGEITELLRKGDAAALEELMPIVYRELHRIAEALFRREYRVNHTLQPTALVNEAYLRLVGNMDDVSWQNRAQFFCIAARLMRQILVNHAVAGRAEKRGGGRSFVALDEALSFFSTRDVEILALHEALEALAAVDRRQSEIVELRFFGGLTIDETAAVLEVSSATVKRDWEMAKAWLYRELRGDY